MLDRIKAKLSIVAVRAFLADEDGTTAIEYAVMASLIAATVVGSVAALANATEGSFLDSANALGN